VIRIRGTEKGRGSWLTGEAALLVDGDVAPVVGDNERVADGEQKKTESS
jgi:hypothetical protein